MARKAKELSPLVVSRLKEPGHHAVGGVAGLYLYVSESGARSWVLRALIAGKRRHMGLGGFPGVPLVLAKEKARQAREASTDALSRLKLIGVDYAQGYLLHRPEPLAALLAVAAGSDH